MPAYGDPLEALKKAESIKPGLSPIQETLGGAFDTGIGALRGLIGLGDDTQSSRFGEMLAAGAPITGGRAVKALLGLLGRKLPAIDIPQTALQSSRVTGRYIPPTTRIRPPEGFELPYWARDIGPARDPLLAERRRQQVTSARRSRLAERNSPLPPSATSLADLESIPAPTVRPEAPPPPMPTRPGRSRQGTGAAAPGGAKGSVTKEQVLQIRAIADAAGGRPGTKIAAVKQQFPQLKESTIRSIVNRDSWSWVQ